MPDDLRIRLHSSATLRGMIHASRLFSLLGLLASIYSADPRLLLVALGFVLWAFALAAMDPAGTTLTCSSIRHPMGEWLCTAHSSAPLLPCELRCHGKLASVLWLDCIFRSSDFGPRNPAKNLLIFHDAVSDEHWRLLRRQLRLESRAQESQP